MLFEQCRPVAFGHSWELVGWFWDGPNRVRVAKCRACGTQKRTRYSKSWQLRGTTYQYPEGYLLGTRLSSEEMRQEVFKDIAKAKLPKLTEYEG